MRKKYVNTFVHAWTYIVHIDFLHSLSHTVGMQSAVALEYVYI